jgi:hypothetical protein
MISYEYALNGLNARFLQYVKSILGERELSLPKWKGKRGKRVEKRTTAKNCRQTMMDGGFGRGIAAASDDNYTH